MKKKRKLGRKLLSFFLTIAFVLGLMPGMGLTAYADDSPYASLKNTTTVVKFDGKDWYLIDYDSSTVTLLSKKCVGASAFDSNGSSNTYSGSTVESYVNDWYEDNISADAKAAVNGSGMFLLTTDQASALSSDVLKCDCAEGVWPNFWWLCSPGINNDEDCCALGVDGDDGEIITDCSVDWEFGVRPALKLNLESVIFDSESKEFTVAVAVTSVSLDPGELQKITVGQTLKITADVYPDNATNKKVKWSLNGADVALYFDEACTIPVGRDATETLIVYAKGMSAGYAEVYAYSDENPDKSMYVDIIVNAATVTLDKESATLTVGGEPVALTAAVSLNDATDKKVKWSVGGNDADAVKLYTDESCATEVGTDATSTLTVYAKGISAGSATVTATSNADNTKSASCDVTVNEATGEKTYADYDVTTDTNKTKSGDDLTALQVTFNDKKWYIIGDNSSSATSGTVTLLSVDTSFGKKTIDNEDESNRYSTSQVKDYLDSMTGTGGAFADVAEAIETVNLTTNQCYSTEVYETVYGVKLYLLSTEEAKSLPENVRKADDDWWLRSPGELGWFAALVEGEDGRVIASGDSVSSNYGVRPALQLDLSKVTFASVNLSGGANAAISGGIATQNYFNMGNTRGAMTTVTYTANANYKFPETSELYKTTNGITVTRTSDTVITVSGTPTANTEITIPDAVKAEPSQLTLNVGENGSVVMSSGIYGNCSGTVIDVPSGIHIDNGGIVKIDNDKCLKVFEGVTIDIRSGGKISFYPGSDNTGTITATPANGYAFAGWYNGETFYSDNAELEYKNISEDLDLTAQFVSTALTPVVSDFTYSAPSDLTYDGNTKTATVVPKEGVTGMGNVTVKYFSDTECTAELVGSPTDVGTYYVGITVAEGDNYSAVSDVLHDSNWKFTISKADAVAATVTANNRTYDGTDKALVNVTGEAKGGEMQYALGTKDAATEEYTTSIPTGTNAGTYYVWYMVVGNENYNDSEPACVEVTVSTNKATLIEEIDAAGNYYNEIKEDYPEIADELSRAIKDAVAVKDNPDATQDEINAAEKAIKDATSNAKDILIQINIFVERINDITKVGEDNKDDVKDLLASYDKLPDSIRTAVDKKLGRAGTKKLSALEDALEVVDKIASIETAENIKLSDEEAVTIARTAYELLSESEKALVSDDVIEKLEAAEAKIEELKNNEALNAAKASAIGRLEDYADAKALSDATQDEDKVINDAVSDGKAAINDAADKDAVAEALTAAKAAVDAALADIKQEREDAAAAKAEMAEADDALETAEENAESAIKAADEAATDEYASDADKKNISDAKAAVSEALKAADDLPDNATAEAKRTVAQAIEDAVATLNEAVDKATVNSDAARAKAEEEADAAAQLEAAKEAAVTRLQDYADAKALKDATIDEDKDYNDAVNAEIEKINAAADKDAVAKALTEAKAAVNAVLTDIENARAKAAADEAEMAAADDALDTAKEYANSVLAEADEATADEYASDDDKNAINNAKEAVTKAVNDAEALSETASAAEKEAAAKAIEDAVAALDTAVDTANINSSEKRAAADEEAAKAEELKAAKKSAIDRLQDYADAKALSDANEDEQKDYNDAVDAEIEKINAAADKDAVAEALTAAKAAVNAVLADIENARAKAAADKSKDDKKEEKEVNKYKNEWVKGQWYDANGKTDYKPKGSWKQNATGWWYEDASGWYPAQCWQKIDGLWYYFGVSGYMAASEWIDGWWCDADGACRYEYQASWKQDSTGWWYGDASGWYAVSSWQKIDNVWYYFGADGYLVTNQYVGEYWVNANGEWAE